MLKNKISPIQLAILSIFLLNAFFTTGLCTYLLETNATNIILTIILGSFIGYIFLKIFLYLIINNKDKNIFELLNVTFPKSLSSLLKVLLLIAVTIISIYVLHNISLFINNTLLNDIDILPISILFIIATSYLSSKGIKTIITASGIFIFIALIFNIVIGITLIPYINTENIRPLVINPDLNIILKSLNYAFITLAPIFLLLTITPNKIANIDKYQKYQKIIYTVITVYIIFKILLILSILGITYFSILTYPEIDILKKVSLLNFIEKIEDNSLTNILINNFIILSISIHYLKECFISTFKIKKDSKIILPIISLGIIILSNCYRLTNINYLFYASLTIVVIHFFILLISITKRKKTLKN